MTKTAPLVQPFRAALLQFCNGGSLAVVFQEDTAAAALGQPGPYRSADIVEKGGCPAAPHDAMLGINEAGQAHGNAVHLPPRGGDRAPPAWRESAPACRPGWDAAASARFSCSSITEYLISVPAYVKDHNFHTRASCLYCFHYDRKQTERQ